MGTEQWQLARGVWHFPPKVVQPVGCTALWLAQGFTCLGVGKPPGTEPGSDGQRLGLSTALAWLDFRSAKAWAKDLTHFSIGEGSEFKELLS